MGFTAAGWSVLCLQLDWSVHFLNSVPTKGAWQCSGLQYSIYLQTDDNIQSCAYAFLLPCLASVPYLLNWKDHRTGGSTDCKYWEPACALLRLLGDLPLGWEWMASGPRLWSWRRSSDHIFPGTLLHLNSICPQGLALVFCVSSREGSVWKMSLLSHLQVFELLVACLGSAELGSAALDFTFLHPLPRSGCASSGLLSPFSGGMESWSVT